MTDPQQTTPIPTNDQQAPQATSQETDFFGGSEDAFQKGVVVNPNEEPAPFVPEEHVREPTVPQEPTAVEGWEVESGEVKIEPIPEPIVEPVIEPITEPIIENIPEPIIEPTIEPVLDPIPEMEPVVEPVLEPEPVVEPEVEQIVEPVAVQENEPVEVNTDTSDLGKKFLELSQLCRQIQEWKKTDEGFELVWADNDKIQILYKFLLGDPEYPMVSVTKVETDKTDEEETTHELNFYLNESGTSLNVNLDEELLFEEEVDLADDVKKRMQVMEKLNKFIFLVTEESKKIEKEIKAKEAEQEEKRKLQDVFRNF